MSVTVSSSTTTGGANPATLITSLPQLQKHLVQLQQTRSQIFHGWSMLFLIMLRTDGESRVRDAAERPSPLPATTLAMYQRAIALITGKPTTVHYLDDGTPAPVSNPGLTPADFNTLVSTTVVTRLQRVNEAFRAVTSPPTDAPNPFEKSVINILENEKSKTQCGARFARWCTQMQEVEKKRFELVVTYQQRVVGHLSETSTDNLLHKSGAGGCCHEAAKVHHLQNNGCVFTKQVASDVAAPLPSSLVSLQVVLSEGIQRGLAWSDEMGPTTNDTSNRHQGGGATKFTMAVSDSEEDVEEGKKEGEEGVANQKGSSSAAPHPCMALYRWVEAAQKELAMLAATMADLIDEANEEIADSQ